MGSGSGFMALIPLACGEGKRSGVRGGDGGAGCGMVFFYVIACEGREGGREGPAGSGDRHEIGMVSEPEDIRSSFSFALSWCQSRRGLSSSSRGKTRREETRLQLRTPKLRKWTYRNWGWPLPALAYQAEPGSKRTPTCRPPAPERKSAGLPRILRGSPPLPPTENRGRKRASVELELPPRKGRWGWLVWGLLRIRTRVWAPWRRRGPGLVGSFLVWGVWGAQG